MGYRSRNETLRARSREIHTPFIENIVALRWEKRPACHRYRMAGTRCLHGTYTTRQRIKRMCVPCFTVQVRSRCPPDAPDGRLRPAGECV